MPGVQPQMARERFVMLGASNLTRGVSTVTSWLKQRMHPPFDLYFAFGFGRSFGIRSTVFGRDLPGIAECGLWAELAKSDAAAALSGDRIISHVLLTDVGNDLFYEQSVDQIERWLRFALERLALTSTRTILAQLPLQNIERVTQTQFLFLTKMLFPGRNLRLDSMKADLHRLARIMETLAAEFGATLVQQPAEWYGFDPIHYRFKLWPQIWDQILTPFSERGAAALALPHPSPRQWWKLRMMEPDLKWIGGDEVRRAQPAVTQADGTKVYFY